MFYLSICLQRGQSDWTLQEAEGADERTGHRAVSWERLLCCAVPPLFLFAVVVVAAAAFTWQNVSIDQSLPVKESKCCFFLSSLSEICWDWHAFFYYHLPRKKQNYETTLIFFAPIYFSKLSVKSDIICGKEGLSQETLFWLQSYEYYL